MFICVLLYRFVFYCGFIFFFFKQKTAYEMRISDWSSDVCSSDLLSLLLTHGSHAGALYVVGIVLGVLMLAPLPLLVDSAADWAIGRASCRERVCQYV